MQNLSLPDYLRKTGISRQAFARRAGLSDEAIRLILLGKRRPRLDTIRAIYTASDGRVWLAAKPKRNGGGRP